VIMLQTKFRTLFNGDVRFMLHFCYNNNTTLHPTTHVSFPLSFALFSMLTSFFL
jgi:hypothetical protein